MNPWLSPKMKKYIATPSTKWGGGDNARFYLNHNPTLTLCSRYGNQRADASTYLCPDLPFNADITGRDLTEMRIRKLTPKECWRLMGFTDKDFEKAQAVNSNTQLYKQAGNSIVVSVLEKLFEQLFKATDLAVENDDWMK